MKNSGIIVAFHVGRGGRFYNAGHVTYIGEKNFQDLIALNDSHIFERNRDEKGRFCVPYLTDHNGTHVTADDINGLTGSLNFDNDYDSYNCDYIENYSAESIELIVHDTQHVKSNELIAWLENNTEYKFDYYGNMIDPETDGCIH